MLAWMGWISVGVAQEIVLEDFDGGGQLAWTDTSPLHGGTNTPQGDFGIAAPDFVSPWSGQAGLCTVVHAAGGLCSASSSSFLVTHEWISMATAGTAYGSAVSVSRVYRNQSLGSFPELTALNTWQERTLDVSAGCGRESRVYWSGAGAVNDAFAIDDLALEGPVCDSYLDRDGDGACPAGEDLDGDGECTDIIEAWPQGTVFDCNDDRPGFDCLVLTQFPPTRGGSMQLTVSGALPGETVWFGMSLSKDDSCALSVGSACLELGSKVVSQQVKANPAGVATASFPVPSGLLPRTTLYAQALAMRGPDRVDSVRSNLAWEVTD